MAYRLEISKAAQHDLSKLDKKVLQAVRKRLVKLAETADNIHHLPLKGSFAGLYKLRVYGKYRVIYDLQREKQLMLSCGWAIGAIFTMNRIDF
jgi:mRNA-degrading endonuclease RelE of RelBE toxin-antitoxin system